MYYYFLYSYLFFCFFFLFLILVCMLFLKLAHCFADLFSVQLGCVVWEEMSI